MTRKIIKLLLSFLLIPLCYVSSQTLVGAYPFPNYSIYNSFWGIAQTNDTLLRIGSDNDGSIYKISKYGVIFDSLTVSVNFNHGLAWDGNGLWIARDVTSNSSRFYKVNLSGQKVDSIQITSLYGNSTIGIGGIAVQGNEMWFACYYPDFSSYPFTYAYKINLTTKLIVDSIPLRGKQVQGIALKGDTILYVTDNFQGDNERIYAYRKAFGDTLFSFAVPDPDNDCDPRGLYWDGQYLYLVANRVGGTTNQYRTLYKYSLVGEGTPQITTSTNYINFGNVVIGNTSNQNLTINNVGTGKLIISAKTITNSVFGINPSVVPDTINPGQFKNYVMSFIPQVYDSTLGELRIISNDMGTPTKIISLRGKGVYNGAYINLSDNNFNFGQRRINSLCGFNFTVKNQGSNTLTINLITTSTQRFRFDNTGITFPVTIDTQKSKIFRVWFNPNSVNTFSDSLIIQSNAVNLPVSKIILSGSGIVITPVLGDTLWSGLIPDNPSTSYDDYQPTSIKQIPDVNADGINDIIVTSGNYLTTCFNGNSSFTSDILWIFNTGYNNNNTGSVNWEDAMQIRDDINSDGIADVVFGCGGGNEMVYTISGKTGQKIWEYGDTVNYSNGDIEGIRVDKDYNNDGVKDVLVSASGTGTGSGGRHSLICLNGLTGAEIFNVIQPAEFTGDIVATDFGGALGLGNNSGSYSVVGFDNAGVTIWNYSEVNSRTWSMKEIPTINTDTIKEIIGMYGFSGNIFCISENSGATLWTKSLGSSNNGKIQLLDDLDSNGYIEIANSCPQTLNRIDTKTSNILWTSVLNSSYIRGIDYLSDVNGDGIRDIAIATQQPGKILVINGTNGNILFEYVFGTNIAQRGDRIGTLNSVDGNSSTEFIGGCRDGRIICFSGGPYGSVNIKALNNVVPLQYVLYQNYPNPFNPVTKIRFELPKSSNVKLNIYDQIGRVVKNLLDKHLQAGVYEIEFDGSGLASGIYYYKFCNTEFVAVKKMLLIK